MTKSIRNRNYYRKQRIRAINRKLAIRIAQWGTQDTLKIYDATQRGKLHKGKVHCSCPMCSRKSSTELSHTDKRKYVKADSQLLDYFKQKGMED